jgi:hypothetical protein
MVEIYITINMIINNSNHRKQEYIRKTTAFLEDVVEVTLNSKLTDVKNLLNYHVIFEESNFKVIGQNK